MSEVRHDHPQIIGEKKGIPIYRQPRFVFVSAKIDLAFAELDVPRFGLLSKEWFWLSHGVLLRESY